jgi:hypothetical protein
VSVEAAGSSAEDEIRIGMVDFLRAAVGAEHVLFVRQIAAAFAVAIDSLGGRVAARCEFPAGLALVSRQAVEFFTVPVQE